MTCRMTEWSPQCRLSMWRNCKSQLFVLYHRLLWPLYHHLVEAASLGHKQGAWRHNLLLGVLYQDMYHSEAISECFLFKVGVVLEGTVAEYLQ